MVMDGIRLAGITPVEDGFLVTPHLPMAKFSLRLPDVGVAAAPGSLGGYVTPVAGGVLTMTVAAPAGHGRLYAFADGRRVRFTRAGADVAFRLATAGGRPAEWAVVRA